MQARRRRGGAAQLAGVHGLVALPVLQLRLDIRRQRHTSQALQHFEEYAVVLELDNAVSTLRDLKNFGFELAAAEDEARAGLGLASGAGHALPAPAAEVAQKQDFHRPAGLPSAHETRREHARIIHHQAVAGAEQLRQLGKHAMLRRAADLIQAKQPRGVPSLQRRLRDELFGQIETKIRCLHALCLCINRYRQPTRG